MLYNIHSVDNRYGEWIVTLCDNNSYAKGALVLARSLRNVGTKCDLVCLISNAISADMKFELEQVYNRLVTVDIINSEDSANLALLNRPELGSTLTKLHIWKLTDYEKMVFMDADMMAVRPIEDLFERDELSAVPDCGWPSCFNSGLFVFRPSFETYGKLIEFSQKTGSFDGGDQGLLNSFFSDWSTANINRILPFGYNVHAAATYTYAPAYKQFANDVRVIHFLGSSKPWTSQSPPSSGGFNSFWNVWWKFYTNNYAPQENFAPSFNPSNCSSESANPIGQSAPQWIDSDTSEAAERRWLENVPDYMNKDSYDKIQSHIQNEINKPVY